MRHVAATDAAHPAAISTGTTTYPAAAHTSYTARITVVGAYSSATACPTDSARPAIGELAGQGHRMGFSPVPDRDYHDGHRGAHGPTERHRHER